MSTRSYICEEQKDGTILAVYCHLDGYLTYNGAMLLAHYKTRKIVHELISLGNMSCLNQKLNPDPSKPHTFDNRQSNVTVFYGRDRGEKGQQARKVKLEDVESDDSWIEYCYVFGKDGKWRYFECGKLKDGLKDLKEGLKQEYQRLGFPQPKGYYGFFTQADIKRRRELWSKKQEIISKEGK